MEIIQKEIRLKSRGRGFHLITDEIKQACPELSKVEVGMAFLHLKHTSASITLNENADPDVRKDMEPIFNHLVPENQPWYVHTFEGPDDMPAHAKSSLIGVNLNLPITKGRFNLGTWQGIYLCEHRNHGGMRSLVITIIAN
ncbi:MAG: YjbQ family protein [Spirochaetales bacterium]|nr:YjbQ family protein [Spirochaetales bacterium]